VWLLVFTNLQYLETEVQELLPEPDLEQIKIELQKLKRAYQSAFPHNKYGSNTDNYAYNRVKAPLNKFKKALLTKEIFTKK